MTAFDAQITFLFVADLDRAAAFYGGVLEFPLARDQGACLIYQTAEKAYLGVCDHRPSTPEGTIVTLVTDDVDGWAKRLRESGIEVEGPSSNERFGIYHCFARDPDGHLIEIQRFQQPLSGTAQG